jgi:hypothetical protein
MPMVDIGLDWSAPLVSRLRDAPFRLSNIGNNAEKLMNEAADEIERLRAVVRRLSVSGDICVYDDIHEVCPGCRCVRATTLRIQERGEKTP